MIKRIAFDLNDWSRMEIESISIDKIDESGDTVTLVLKLHNVESTLIMEDVKDA